MNNVKLLKTVALKELTASIEANLEKYRSGSFDFLEVDSANYFEIDAQLDTLKIALVSCTPTDHNEIECCIAIHESLTGVTPYLARDPRLWVYLTHTVLLQYARTRWPIPDDKTKAISHIKKHFFAIGNRGIERDNAASRIWWMASLCYRVSNIPLREALSAFLDQYDVRANIIERPTTSQSVTVFNALVHRLCESYKSDKKLLERENFRPVMKKLNLKGGVKLLEALNDTQVNSILDECTSNQ